MSGPENNPTGTLHERLRLGAGFALVSSFAIGHATPNLIPENRPPSSFFTVSIASGE